MKKVKIQLENQFNVQDAMKFATRKAAEKYISEKEGRVMIFFKAHAYYTSI